MTALMPSDSECQKTHHRNKPRQKIFLASDGETRFVFEGQRLTIQRKMPMKNKVDFRWMAVDRYLLTDNRSATMTNGPNEW